MTKAPEPEPRPKQQPPPANICTYLFIGSITFEHEATRQQPRGLPQNQQKPNLGTYSWSAALLLIASIAFGKADEYTQLFTDYTSLKNSLTSFPPFDPLAHLLLRGYTDAFHIALFPIYILLYTIEPFKSVDDPTNSRFINAAAVLSGWSLVTLLVIASITFAAHFGLTGLPWLVALAELAFGVWRWRNHAKTLNYNTSPARSRATNGVDGKQFGVSRFLQLLALAIFVFLVSYPAALEQKVSNLKLECANDTVTDQARNREAGHDDWLTSLNSTSVGQQEPGEDHCGEQHRRLIQEVVEPLPPEAKLSIGR